MKRKNLKRFLLKVDSICCDLRELDLKNYQVMRQSTVTLGVNDFLLTSEDET